QGHRSTTRLSDGLFYLISEMSFLHPTDSQKVGKGPDHSIADIVLRPSKPPGAVVYLDLRYREALHLGKGRKEPVHTVEELHVFQTFSSKGLQRTARIGDLLLAQLIPDEVGYLRGNDLDPRISSLVPPSADNV